MRLLGFDIFIVAYRDPIFALGVGSILNNFWVGDYLVKTNENGTKEFYVKLISSLN